eukprot:Sspe_Gene.20307::Locus_7446_Transcript_2_2_Confidence_0.667_Length_4109::g.20307::m.20307
MNLGSPMQMNRGDFPSPSRHLDVTATPPTSSFASSPSSRSPSMSKKKQTYPSPSRHRKSMLGGPHQRSSTRTEHTPSMNPFTGRGWKRTPVTESSENAKLGVTQMASLVISHLLAPLWSVGLDGNATRFTPVKWDSKRVRDFARQMDEEFRLQHVHHILEAHTDLTTVYLVLTLARLEHLERTSSDTSYADLLSKTLESRQKAKAASYGWHRWNDECYSDHRKRSLTAIGGAPLEALHATPECTDTIPSKLKAYRRHLWHSALLTSCVCRYNFREEALIEICSEICTRMFLISPAEELTSLCCGEKGPVYLSKYLRFLMETEPPTTALTEDDVFLPPVYSYNHNLPHAIQDAMLPILVALLNLAHSTNDKAGQNLCFACSIAIKEHLSRIDEYEEKLTSWDPTAARPSNQDGEKTRMGFPLFKRSVEQKEMKVAQLAKDEIPDKKRRKVGNMRKLLPSLLSLVKLILCHIHCYGDDAPQAWAELMSVTRGLMIYPLPTGRLACEVLRAAAAAVQCMDSLLRHRLALCFIGGGNMHSFQRERAYILVNPLALNAMVIRKVFLGRVKRAKPEGPHGHLLHIPIMQPVDPKLRGDEYNTETVWQQREEEWSDDILAPASLLLNIFYRIARQEAEQEVRRREGRPLEGAAMDPPLDATAMHDVLSQLPPTALAQYYPAMYRLLRGSIGGAGRMMTFSEGGGKSLKVVDTLYRNLGSLYQTIVEETRHHRREDMTGVHVPSPECPMLDLVCKTIAAKKEKKHGVGLESRAMEWGRLLQSLIEEEHRYRRTQLQPVEALHPNAEVNPPKELRIVLAGGSGTLMHFCNGLMYLARTGQEPMIKVYLLPLGCDNMMAGFLGKVDHCYSQIVSWPLQQVSRDLELEKTPADSSDDPEASSLESAMLRTAIDTLLVDASVSNRIFIYQCEFWRCENDTRDKRHLADPRTPREDRNKKTDSDPPDGTLAWCSQIEIGPHINPPDNEMRSPRNAMPSSPMSSNTDGYDAVSPAGGRTSLSRRRTTSTSRNFPGQISYQIVVGSGPEQQAVDVDEMHSKLQQTESTLLENNHMHLTDRPSIPGRRVLDWIVANYRSMLMSEADATQVAHRMLEKGLLQPLRSDDGRSFREGGAYVIGSHDQVRRACEESTRATRRPTMVSDQPINLCISHTPTDGSPEIYYDLGNKGQADGMMVYKIAVKNTAREGDRGLIPDPTRPELEAFVHGFPRKDLPKRPTAPIDGQHYTILGSFVVEVPATSNGSFNMLIDGECIGSLRKVRINPLLIPLKDSHHATHRHLNFQLMSFIPLEGYGL